MTDPNNPEQPGAVPPTPPTTPPAAPTPPAAAPAYGQPAAPAYGQPAAPAYGQPAPGYGQPAAGKTNTLAIVSLVASIAGLVILPFLGALAGVICGHISLSQIKKTGEQGHGMALAGTIIGYVGIVLSIIAGIALIAWSAWFFATYGTDTPMFPMN